MNLPLYAQAREALSNRAEHELTPNLGLKFERFFSAYSADFTEVPNSADKSEESLRAGWLAGFDSQPAGVSALLKNKALAVQQLLSSQGGEGRVYKCDGNFVTGIGNSHPLENGFLWHHTLGTPYLSGASIKGLVRTVVETAYDDSDDEARDSVLKRWFGTTNFGTTNKEDVSEQAGCLIFFDALPVDQCTLSVEIMTPHMGKWYEKGAKDPLSPEVQPGDWHSPVPVSYLVAKKIRLQFGIMPRPGAQLQPDDLSNAWAALEHGLSYLGAGAKTSIGFGYFVRDKHSEDQLRDEAQQGIQQQIEREQIAKASPLEAVWLKLAKTMPDLKGKSAGDAAMTQFWGNVKSLIEQYKNEASIEECASLKEKLREAIKSNGIALSKQKEKELKELLNQLS